MAFTISRWHCHNVHMLWVSSIHTMSTNSTLPLVEMSKNTPNNASNTTLSHAFVCSHASWSWWSSMLSLEVIQPWYVYDVAFCNGFAYTVNLAFMDATCELSNKNLQAWSLHDKAHACQKGLHTNGVGACGGEFCVWQMAWVACKQCWKGVVLRENLPPSKTYAHKHNTSLVDTSTHVWTAPCHENPCSTDYKPS